MQVRPSRAMQKKIYIPKNISDIIYDLTYRAYTWIHHNSLDWLHKNIFFLDNPMKTYVIKFFTNSLLMIVF